MPWQNQSPPAVITLIPTSATTFVQSASSQTLTTTTATFTNPITAGNSVIAAFQAGTGESIVPTSGPDTFTIDATAGAGVGAGSPNIYFAHVSNSAGGYTGVKASGSASTTCALFIYEVAGAVTFGSNSAASAGTNGQFNVNFTPGSSGEFLAGIALDALGSGNFGSGAGGGGRWTQSGTTGLATSSYQSTVATSAVNYATSGVGSGATAAAVAGYVLASSGIPATPTTGCILFYTNGQLWALGESGVPALLATT